MSIGIYALYFEQDDSKVYIGQSTKIEDRYADHIGLLERGKHHQYKLQEAYSKFGCSPSMQILEISPISNLDDLENKYISEFDSIYSGYNVINGGSGGRGYTASRQKYSRELLLEIANLLCDATLSSIDIANKVGVKVSLVQTIAYNKRHHWITEEFPELRQQIDLLTKSKARFLQSNDPKRRNDTIYCLISPEGEYYYITNISKHAKEFGLNKSHLSQVLQGKVPHHKNWRKGVS